jgi:ABC-type multidrug transport system ATPase subunit
MGDYMNQLCGYVPQEDIFVRDVTVREHLHFMVGPNKKYILANYQ